MDSELSRKRSHSSSRDLASDVKGSKKSSKKSLKRASKKCAKEKSRKMKLKKKRKKHYSSGSSDSSDSSDSSSTSSSSSTSTDSSEDRRRREKKKKKKSKMKRQSKEKVVKGKQVIAVPVNKNKKLKTEPDDGPDVGPNIDLRSSKIRAPMTKEEYEKQQSTLRWVDDPETGRRRLIRGTGEIVETIVSKERHQAINKQASAGDGQFFHNQSLAKAKSSNQK